MKMDNNQRPLITTKAMIDGRCLDLILTEEEVIAAHARSFNPEYSLLLGDDCCSCWPVEREPCGFWDRLLNKCECDRIK